MNISLFQVKLTSTTFVKHSLDSLLSEVQSNIIESFYETQETCSIFFTIIYVVFFTIVSHSCNVNMNMTNRLKVTEVALIFPFLSGWRMLWAMVGGGHCSDNATVCQILDVPPY